MQCLKNRYALMFVLQVLLALLLISCATKKKAVTVKSERTDSVAVCVTDSARVVRSSADSVISARIDSVKIMELITRAGADFETIVEHITEYTDSVGRVTKNIDRTISRTSNYNQSSTMEREQVCRESSKGVSSVSEDSTSSIKSNVTHVGKELNDSTYNEKQTENRVTSWWNGLKKKIASMIVLIAFSAIVVYLLRKYKDQW